MMMTSPRFPFPRPTVPARPQAAPEKAATSQGPPALPVPQCLFVGPQTRSTEWLFAERDQSLAWQIRHLSSALRRMACARELDVWTATAVGAPLLRAQLIDLAWRVGVHDLPSGVTSSRLWELVREPLTELAGESAVAEGGAFVLAALALFDLVDGYAFGQVDRANATTRTWFMDSQALWRLVDSAHRVLVEFSTGVEVRRTADHGATHRG